MTARQSAHVYVRESKNERELKREEKGERGGEREEKGERGGERERQTETLMAYLSGVLVSSSCVGGGATRRVNISFLCVSFRHM